MKKIKEALIIVLSLAVFIACNSGNTNKSNSEKQDSGKTEKQDTTSAAPDKDTSKVISDKSTTDNKKAEQPVVLIYNFHVTNRCPSCIAIEDATTKTLKTYFANEVKQGRIKRQILNVDDDANKFISQKYEAFGSGLFVTRVFKDKETTTDLTGDGFKYAKNKEEKFIEILKTTISGYLK